MTIDTTRRAFLMSAPVAAAATALPIKAIAAAASRSAWDAAFRAFEEAEAEDKAFAPIFNDLHERWRAAVDAVPHVTFCPDPYSGSTKPISTSDDFFVLRARRLLADVEAGKCRFEPHADLDRHLELCRQVVAAADQRKAKIDAISAAMGYDKAEKHWEGLSDAVEAARWALIAMPAPDLSALHWKLSYILEDDGTESIAAWQSRLIEQTRADMRRLLIGEA